MDFPVWIPIGPWRIHPHLFFETLAYVIGFRLYLARRRALGDHLPDAARWSVVTAAVVGAVIGSRLLFWAEDPAKLLVDVRTSLTALGGKTIVGALLGGWIAVELEKRRIGIRQPTGDLFVVPLAIGIAIGRIGCFLTGLEDGTYGTATSMPWGMDVGDGVRRHPTALYESLFVIALAYALSRVHGRLPRGALFKLFMGGYLLFRLAVDFVKPDARMALGMSSIQWACIAALACLALYAVSMKHDVAPGDVSLERP